MMKNNDPSHYDLSTHTVDYEVKVKAKHGSISGINYQDTCAQGMTLVEGSVKYYSLDGQTQYDNYPTSLQSNEGFIIKYSMKIDDSVFENQGKRVFNADNTINVSGTNGEEKPVNVSDDATQKVTSEFLSKSGHLDNSNGTPRIRWTVTVGDGYTPVDGLVVKDILGEGLSFDTSEQIKITPYRYNPETDKLESHQIADAFYDYRYDPVESGLRKYIGSRENMFIYMNAIVRAAYKTGILYTTSDMHEGYMMLSGDGFKSISLIDGLKMISAEKKALGGFRKMAAFVKACFSDGGTIEARMKKTKKRFIRVEMLVVRKEYQKQGFMKQMLDDVYRLADHKGVAVMRSLPRRFMPHSVTIS